MEDELITILLVEDDKKIRKMLYDYLTMKDGYIIKEASTGEQAMELFYLESNQINLVLLDLCLPGADGNEVLEEIRKYSEVPVIMITAKGDTYSQLKCFEHGADDYVTKPFTLSLLRARIHAMLKRVMKNHESELYCGDILIQKNNRQALQNNSSLSLSVKEFDLLCYFAEHKGQLLSRKSILDAIWGLDYEGDERTVDTVVKQIRAKISGCNVEIVTVYGAGYRLEDCQ